MKDVSYTDDKGRQWMVSIPDDSPNSDANLGIPIGPPSLQGLNLPEHLEILLHNALFIRKIWTSKDIKHRRAEVIDAIKSVYKTDAEKIYVCYLEYEKKS